MAEDKSEGGNLYQRLVAVRASVDHVTKSEHNAKQNYNYAGSAQVLAAIRGAMNTEGVMVIPSVVDAQISDHTTKNGSHQYFTALTIEYTIVNVDDPADNIIIRWHGQGMDSSEKGVGKALTYAEKYLFMKLFNIPTPADDPDAADAPGNNGGPPPPRGYQRRDGDEPPKASPNKPCSDKQRSLIWRLASQIWETQSDDERRDGLSRAAARCQLPTSTKDMSSADASVLIDELNTMIARDDPRR